MPARYPEQKIRRLRKYSTDTQGLKAFILRLQDNKTTDIAWLESVVAFLGKSPPNKWLQTSRIEAEYSLIDFSTRLLRLAQVHPHNTKESNIAVVRFVDNHGENDQTAYLTEQQKAQAKEIVDSVLKDNDKPLNIAVIAEIMNRMRS